MDISQIDGSKLLGGMAAAMLVLVLWAMALILWSMRRRNREQTIRERLETVRERADRTLRLWHDGVEASVVVPGSERDRSLSARYSRLQRDMGWTMSWQRALLTGLAAALGTGALTASLTESLLNGLFAVVVLSFAFAWYVGYHRAKRAALFERQLVDGLELSARALRSGHPLLSSFQLIAEEIEDPVGRLFGDVCQQHQMGVSLEQALREASDSSRSDDMRLFSASLSIHLRSGGNIADVVEGIAAVIRQRMRLARRVRVLTAQTQLSKRILLGMPVVIFATLHILNPSYAEVLYATDSGKLLLLVSVSMMLAGWWTMNRMAVVRM